MMFFMFKVCALYLLGLLLLTAGGFAEETAVLPGTIPLRFTGDFSSRMVNGIDKHLNQLTASSVAGRGKFWKRDYGSAEAYETSIQPNREHLRAMIGAVDSRVTNSVFEYVSTTARAAKLAETERYLVYAVRWTVFEDVHGEGLLLQPKRALKGKVIAIPDADQTPEMLAGLAPGIPAENQFARILANQDCAVLVPTLISRADTWSGSEKLKRFTNQPHREWIYRQAYEMGRHLIGYEVEKIFAALDAFSRFGSGTVPMGVAGYGEGGLVGLYAAALDNRVQSALVSGYFGSREQLWDEPIYRNVFGLLREFGDAEIASLVAPRTLIVEQSEAPAVPGPPPARTGRSGAAPGKIVTPDVNVVETELTRAKELAKQFGEKFQVISGNEGRAVGPGGVFAVQNFLAGLGVGMTQKDSPPPVSAQEGDRTIAEERQKQQVQELVEHTQKLLRSCERAREDFVWHRLQTASPADYEKSLPGLKQEFWENTIGRVPSSALALTVQAKKSYEEEKWTGYDVVIDVFPDVFAWGVLLLPKDIKPGERRPVVVCQHGLEGVPADTITRDPKAPGFQFYKGFSAQLADRGFVVFAPHNPYRGHDDFRVLQRKANPLKLSLFSYIIAQHDRILDWLSQQSFVDPERIGFYGLSYGGKTAMRVPAVLDRYALSICSGDFNEWVRKNVSVDQGLSYMFTMEYEMPEWNLGHTFNYAEMAALIVPRPFMVERGHSDGVGVDEWVAYEYAKVRRLYNRMDLGERTEIEFFNGPHTIHGKGTFDFLSKHLQWTGSSK
jgi:dienelactone hydrolase